MKGVERPSLCRFLIQRRSCCGIWRHFPAWTNNGHDASSTGSVLMRVPSILLQPQTQLDTSPRDFQSGKRHCLSQRDVTGFAIGQLLGCPHGARTAFKSLQGMCRLRCNQRRSLSSLPKGCIMPSYNWLSDQPRDKGRRFHATDNSRNELQQCTGVSSR